MDSLSYVIKPLELDCEKGGTNVFMKFPAFVVWDK